MLEVGTVWYTKYNVWKSHFKNLTKSSLDIIPINRSISIMTRINNKSYLYIHNEDYEYKYKLHLKRRKCSLTYKNFKRKVRKSCAEL